ncbi:MAG: hypothetical protein C4334_02785 [Pyrinomonas sp.]
MGESVEEQCASGKKRDFMLFLPALDAHAFGSDYLEETNRSGARSLYAHKASYGKILLAGKLCYAVSSSQKSPGFSRGVGQRMRSSA